MMNQFLGKTMSKQIEFRAAKDASCHLLERRVA